MKTTLIISTYNRPEALSVCLDSVRFQTVMPDEVIVGDDGSTSETKDLITRVRDNILKSKEQKNIQPTKGGHKMVTCQNYVSLFYRQITSCPSDGGIS